MHSQSGVLPNRDTAVSRYHIRHILLGIPHVKTACVPDGNVSVQ